MLMYLHLMEETDQKVYSNDQSQKYYSTIEYIE